VSSIGEADLIFNSRGIGKIRALYIFPDSALYPRLGIQISVSLYETGNTPQPASGTRPVGYELLALTGELRVSEHGPVIGTVHWAERPRPLQTFSFPTDHQLKLICDLDHLRIERIEVLRAGKAPSLSLQLWPTLLRGGELLDGQIRPISLQVARDSWLEFLSRTRSDQYEVIEVRFRPEEAPAYKAALEHVRTARLRLDAGDPKAAVGACRLALDAIIDENPRITKSQRPEETKELWLFAEERSHRKSVEQYKIMFSKLQQMTSTAHHHYAAGVEFRRSEAQFAIRMCEALIALLGDLTTRE
jgi:hypothetical protein